MTLSRHHLPYLTLLLLALGASAAPAAPSPVHRSVPSPALRVMPAAVTLVGPEAEQALLVTVRDAQGLERDATRTARYASSNPSVVRVTPAGLLRITGNGTVEVRVTAGGRSCRVPVRTREATVPRRLNFTNQILPVISKAGCNQGTCHGKASGQGGFKLSVLAFDPQADYDAIVKDARGRRVRRSAPERSLILLKPTAGIPHGGGLRFRAGSPEYRLLRRWIAEGMPFGDAHDPVLHRIEVAPAERVLLRQKEQPLLVTAIFSDGSRRDVTREAAYSSNEDEIAAVDPSGRIRTADVAGEAAIMVRYMGQVTVARVTVPYQSDERPTTNDQRRTTNDEGRRTEASSVIRHPSSVRTVSDASRMTYDVTSAPVVGRSSLVVRRSSAPTANFVDSLVLRKLAQLRILPSGRCTDAEFVRRAFLDVIGTLPTPEEARAFFRDRDTDKRAKLVDALLGRPEYADTWGMRWADIFLVNRDPLFPKGAYAFDRWVRENFRRNRPYNELAYDVLTAQGQSYRDGPANFFRSADSPTDAAIAVSQLFLGVRLECAQCHHHPFERWSQDDFYSLAAFFARMRRKGGSEYEQVVYAGDTGEVKQPRTGKLMAPRPLLGSAPPTEDGDLRISLAKWVTSPENPFFARVVVNRIWAVLMGRGLFEPVDDQRTTNPASNEPLLQALAGEFVRNNYDFKHLIRVIMASDTYQRSAEPNPTNAADTRNYSRAVPKRLPAEVLMDAVGQVTGSAELFSGLPPGLRATQLWDSKLDNYFLSVFGRPGRISVCACDRSSDGSVVQMLHLMNSPGVQTKLAAPDGRAAQLAASSLNEDQIVTDLYLSAYSRPPTPRERLAARAAYRRPGATRRTATEDILWALINSSEFVFNH